MSTQSPFSTREYPPWADTIFRVIRGISYTLAAGMGVGLLFFYPTTPRYPDSLNDVCGLIAIISGLFCLQATIRKRWIQEWLALFFLIFSVSIYAVIAVSRMFITIEDLAGACALLWLLMGNLFRLAELTIFFEKSVRSARIRKGVPHVNG